MLLLILGRSYQQKLEANYWVSNFSVTKMHFWVEEHSLVQSILSHPFCCKEYQIFWVRMLKWYETYLQHSNDSFSSYVVLARVVQGLLRDSPLKHNDRVPFQRSLNLCVIGLAESHTREFGVVFYYLFIINICNYAQLNALWLSELDVIPESS